MKKKIWRNIFVACLCIFGQLTFCSCGGNSIQTTDYTTVETPYCTLSYPTEWKDYLIVEQNGKDPLTLAYYAQLDGKQMQHLFNVCFNSDEGSYIGTVCTADGQEVNISVEISTVEFDTTWTEAERRIVLEMQDDLNFIIQNMLLRDEQEGIIPTEQETLPLPTTPVSYEYIVVDSAYGQLCYSSEWANTMNVMIHQEEDYVVSFYAITDNQEQIHLYDIFFSNNLEDAVGVLEIDNQTVGVKAAVYPILEAQEDQLEMLTRMQETFNEVLHNLHLKNIAEQPEETQPGVETQPTEGNEIDYADVEIDTPYAKVVYSGKWKDQLRIDIEEGDIYSVVFYGKINNKPEMRLFTLCFGVAEDEAIGIIHNTLHGNIGVGIIVCDVTFDNEWTEDDKNMFYAMLEEVNIILDNLNLNMVN